MCCAPILTSLGFATTAKHCTRGATAKQTSLPLQRGEDSSFWRYQRKSEDMEAAGEMHCGEDWGSLVINREHHG